MRDPGNKVGFLAFWGKCFGNLIHLFLRSLLGATFLGSKKVKLVICWILLF